MKGIRNKITRVHLSGYKEENMDIKLSFCVDMRLDLANFLPWFNGEMWVLIVSRRSLFSRYQLLQMELVLIH
jgi:hypothetical protein